MPALLAGELDLAGLRAELALGVLRAGHRGVAQRALVLRRDLAGARPLAAAGSALAWASAGASAGAIGSEGRWPLPGTRRPGCAAPCRGRGSRRAPASRAAGFAATGCAPASAVGSLGRLGARAARASAAARAARPRRGACLLRARSAVAERRCACSQLGATVRRRPARARRGRRTGAAGAQAEARDARAGHQDQQDDRDERERLHGPSSSDFRRRRALRRGLPGGLLRGRATVLPGRRLLLTGGRRRGHGLERVLLPELGGRRLLPPLCCEAAGAAKPSSASSSTVSSRLIR